MLNLAIHRVERVDVGAAVVMSTGDRIFATRSITVTYLAHDGELRTQEMALFAESPESLDLLTREAVTA